MQRLTLTCLFLGTLCPFLAWAGDEELAGKLQGNWFGFWRSGDRIGRLSVSMTTTSGQQLEGFSIWYGLAGTEMKLPFERAEIRDGRLLIDHAQGPSLEGKPERNVRSLKGNWSSATGGGHFELKKKSH